MHRSAIKEHKASCALLYVLCGTFKVSMLVFQQQQNDVGFDSSRPWRDLPLCKCLTDRGQSFAGCAPQDMGRKRFSWAG